MEDFSHVPSLMPQDSSPGSKDAHYIINQGMSLNEQGGKHRIQGRTSFQWAVNEAVSSAETLFLFFSKLSTTIGQEMWRTADETNSSRYHSTSIQLNLKRVISLTDKQCSPKYFVFLFSDDKITQRNKEIQRMDKKFTVHY